MNTLNGAPTLARDWEAELRALAPGWDSYGAVPITEAAITAVKAFLTVPRNDGGIDLEVHLATGEAFVFIAPDGSIRGVSMERWAAPEPPPEILARRFYPTVHLSRRDLLPDEERE